MKELKPCPFCGGNAEIIKLCGFSEIRCVVACTKCKARTTDIGQALDYCAYDKVAAMWNTRYDEPVNDE